MQSGDFPTASLQDSDSKSLKMDVEVMKPLSCLSCVNKPVDFDPLITFVMLSVSQMVTVSPSWVAFDKSGRKSEGPPLGTF